MFNNDTSIILPETFELIKKLQEKQYLSDFFLVGGTSLALQIGHRFSIDIDLFTQNEFITAELIENLEQDFEIKIIHVSEKNTLISNINNVKTDFIRHPCKFVKSPILLNGIKYLSCEDIAAMKVNAIINSGQRYKDFIDIYYLLEKYSMQEIIYFFNSKYPNYTTSLAFKALSFFDDINFDLDPPILKNKLKVDEVKKRILSAINNSKKIFK